MTGGRRDALLEAAIDTPRDGGTSESWAIRVTGHLLGAGGPPQSIEAVTPGAILASTRPMLPTPEVAVRHPSISGAAACGFSLLVDTLALPRQFDFRLRATLADDTRVKIASIGGERATLVSGYTPRLQPLLLTSLARVGTTLLMRMLAAHPAVVTYARPPYEARGAKYWLHVLKTLGAPTLFSKRVGSPTEFHLETLAAGGNPFFTAEFAAWPEVEAWMGRGYVRDLAAFCQRSIDGWYLATAQAQGQRIEGVAYFAEKHFADGYSRLMRELYPDAREVFLVRDFRDMVASMLAYNERKGYGDFGRVRYATDAEWLAGLGRGAVVLRDAWRERGSDATLVRYEDLVQRPGDVLPPLLDAIGLAADPEIVDNLIGTSRPDRPELRGHGTAASPDASIGRWQRDLPPELQAVVQETFGELLAEFGYFADTPSPQTVR